LSAGHLRLACAPGEPIGIERANAYGMTLMATWRLSPVSAPDVDVLQFTPAGPLLCVRPYCRNEHYWQVYFDTNRLIREAFGEAGFPAPVPSYAVSGMPMVPPSLPR
jgi:small-conductance mechanosensitive channel